MTRAGVIHDAVVATIQPSCLLIRGHSASSGGFAVVYEGQHPGEQVFLAVITLPGGIGTSVKAVHHGHEQPRRCLIVRKTDDLEFAKRCINRP